MGVLSKSNLIWTIAVLAALLTGTLSVQWATVPGLPDIISLALSLASLLLAVVAIFQALTSNESLSRAVGHMIAAAESAKEATSNVELAGRNLASQVDGLSVIPGKIGEMSEKLKEISEANQKSSSSDGPTISGKSSITLTVDDFFKVGTYGVDIGLYLALMSYKHKKFVIGNDVFDNANAEYYSAVISTLRATGIIKADLKSGKFLVRDLGLLSEDMIIGRANKEDAGAKFRKKQIEKIDAFFS